jgi:hypothetical protein
MHVSCYNESCCVLHVVQDLTYLRFGLVRRNQLKNGHVVCIRHFCVLLIIIIIIIVTV